MSDRDDDELIENDETRSRRDWVARALQAVRRRLEAGERIPEAAETDAPPEPHLYVVRSRPKR